METEYYIERVNRFVVEYLEQYPAQHRAEMRLNGIDPDNYWQLKWSFETAEGAEKQLARENERYGDFCREYGYEPTTQFRVQDMGAPVEIKRSVMF